MSTFFPDHRASIIGYCACCERPIRDGNEEYLSDEYYQFEDDMVCEDCLIQYCNENFRKGGE